MSFFKVKPHTSLTLQDNLTAQARLNALGQAESSVVLLEKQLHRLTQLLIDYQQHAWSLKNSGQEALAWVQRVLGQ